ncbi:hypothetical protein NDU88_005596 [Pleurodeles waltl]|uniref:Uncharacterized protein n=1 Tax=Pleurodeles waltl TaxID=8319 RepID=A0AAV7MHD6_PLEWA|nr:hypothetical protein NDU88_005596 [Pleurodeles waltl]
MLKRVGLREDSWVTPQMVLVAPDRKGGRRTLSSAGEEGSDPVQSFVADPSVVEASAEGVVADGVKSSREVLEDEGRGFAFVDHGPDLVGRSEEGSIGAVVRTES